MNNSMERQSRSSRAGLMLPVSRIHRYLRNGNFSTSRIGSGAPVYLAAVLEYLLAEIIDQAADVAGKHNKKRITSRVLNLAIRNDDEMCHLLSKVTISNGGVVPNINKMLLPK